MDTSSGSHLPAGLTPTTNEAFLQSLLLKGEYSDLTIKFGEETHRVHRVIVCTQSRVFATMRKGPFLEAQTGVIDLPEDNLGLVRAMIFRLYGYSYRDIKAVVFHSQADDPELDIEIYTLGDKYEYLALQADAIKNFKQWAEGAWSSSEFRTLTQKIWDHPYLFEMHRLVETIIADHVTDFCSPAGGAEDSLVKQGLQRGIFTEHFVLWIANRNTQ